MLDPPSTQLTIRTICSSFVLVDKAGDKMRSLVDGQLAMARSRTALWEGRSGRRYGLVTEPLESFSMRETDVYVIAKGSLALWAGSTDDLVADPASRNRFRLALDCATQVLRLAAPEDRAAARWDLEGAMPVSVAPTAQAA
jgi:hypothetical protein